MGFEVSVMKFEGPLDLMLHLIHEEKLDIFDLDMDVLTDQYIRYLHEMDDLHLEIESEYLVELSTLIEYKSKRLLPKKGDSLDDEYEEDPKERLVRRLLEYQQYKEVSRSLYDAYMDRQGQLSKPISFNEVMKSSASLMEEQKLEGNPYDLLKAMTKVLRRIELQRPIDMKIAQKELSTEDRILQLKTRMRDFTDTFSFHNLIEDCHSVHEYIVTFLAILDMAKDHYLVFSIDEQEEIWFRRGSSDE